MEKNVFIGILNIELSIVFQETIKERRNIIRSIKDMVRNKFNVSVADITDPSRITPKVEIGIIGVSHDLAYAQSILSNILNLIENQYSEILQNYKMDYIDYQVEYPEKLGDMDFRDEFTKDPSL